MHPLTTYDYLCGARARLFDAARGLSDAQASAEHPIGLRRLDRTLAHIMISEWYYVQRMHKRPVPPYEQWPVHDESPPLLAEIERFWLEQAPRTRADLESIERWDERIEYEVTNDDGEREIVIASPADLLTQLVLHEVHHRAQAMNMLRHLGAPCQDLDYNAGFERRPVIQPGA